MKSTLSKKESLYFNIMKSKNVLYLKSAPGLAKSSILKSIADKKKYQYFDVRLSMADETDFKFPMIEDMDGQKVTGFSVPKWAMMANEQPSIVHFEEINRASDAVRNASMGILLERVIDQFSFNDNVMFCCSGNLGEEDGTNVEEFDSALNNRLVHVNHELTIQEWMDEFATENVHPMICSFINAHPEYYYKKPQENENAYATPRSWTMLSNFIISTYTKEASPSTWADDILYVGASFVGSSINRFIRYVEETSKINIKDIIDNFKQVEKETKEFNRSKIFELLESLKSYEFENFNEKQLSNISDFLKVVDDSDLVAGYLQDVLSPELLENEIFLKFFKSLKKYISSMKKVIL